jgi:hypothetical protein
MQRFDECGRVWGLSSSPGECHYAAAPRIAGTVKNAAVLDRDGMYSTKKQVFVRPQVVPRRC